MQERREAVIDPPHPYPARAGLRYELSPRIVAKLEKLAVAEFEIGRFTNHTGSNTSELDAATLWNIAQSVNASSEIAGEEIPASKLHIALAAARRPSTRREHELDRRMLAVSSIIRTFLWLLAEPPREYISFELVLEAHRRMFKSTAPEIAGRIASTGVTEKSTQFLRELCDRTNRSLTAGDTSRFLATAEFIVDFLTIHPFEDGNGRTARLLATYLLERTGYPFGRFYALDNVVLENRRGYGEALVRSQQRWYQFDEDLTSWIELFTDMVFTQYVRAFQVLQDTYDRRMAPIPRNYTSLGACATEVLPVPDTIPDREAPSPARGTLRRWLFACGGGLVMLWVAFELYVWLIYS